MNDPELLPELEPVLPPEARPLDDAECDVVYSLWAGQAPQRAGVRRFNIAYQNGQRISRSLDMGEVLHVLENYVNLVVAARASRRLFLHAGAVEWNGRAIVLPGRTHAGKSTLTAAFVRAGAKYLSDEYAVFDSQQRVHPYLKPISMRRSEGRPQPVRPEELGGKSRRGAAPVGLVLHTQYREGARFRPRRLSPGQGVLKLLNNTVAARKHTATVLSTLHGIADRAPVIDGPRGEADELVEYVLRRWERLIADA